MDLHHVVDTSAAIGATRSRKRKIAALAELVRTATGDDRRLAVAYLVGAPPQGRIGVGWATVAGLDTPPADDPTLQLTEVDAVLSQVAATTGGGSRQRRRAQLDDLLRRAVPDEQSFLRRLLLGEMRHGALDGVMVEAVADAADVPPTLVRRAYMLSDDLGAVAAAALDGGAAALRAFRLRLFQPIQPMLAQTADDVADALDDLSTAVVDAKIDGVRVQVHRDDDHVAIFTRSLRDITADVPGIAHAARDLDVRSVILDGEAVRMDAAGRPAPFQETMAGATDGLAVRFFDCLHHDGTDLIDAPLHHRSAVLQAVVGPRRMVARTVVENAVDAAAFFDRAVTDGYEGVVVKAPDSTYEAGRRGAAWRKVKPHHTLDLVVLAAEWGSGRRRGWLSNLHLGARDPDGGFVMLGKTFKGLTDALLTWQTERLLALETHRSGHVVHVEPELVVEIAFDGVQTSTRYPGGVALRFARVVRYRDDKHAAQADTIDAVRAIRSPTG
jgi:DNA ligase-1